MRSGRRCEAKVCRQARGRSECVPGKRKTVTRFSQLGRDGEQRRKESQEWTSQMGGRVAALGTCTRQTLTLTGALGSCFPTFAFHKSHEASELSSRHKNVSEFITENIINNETDVYGESGESIFCCELYNCRAATSSLSQGCRAECLRRRAQRCSWHPAASSPLGCRSPTLACNLSVWPPAAPTSG